MSGSFPLSFDYAVGRLPQSASLPLEHTLQHPLGLFHLVIAVVAIGVGGAIVLMRKGTMRHRWLGRAYLVSMLLLNVSALMIYELFGGFGMFHWAAVASLVTVLAGYLEARRRTRGWKVRHAFYMSGSYVGLIAALAAETLTRTPLLPFYGSVAVASFSIIAAGLWLMFRYIPR